jgi:hypothetical protein
MTVAVVVGAIENADRRMQQLTSNYRATYSADFQHFSEVLCDGAPPTLLVGCKGSGMTILNTSNARIVCEPSQQFRLFSNVTSSTAYECTVNCTESDADCLAFYRYKTPNPFLPLNGPFGSILFRCEGGTVDEVDAAFVYRGGTTDGFCGASTSETAMGRNYHIGRLGVSCPVGDGSSLREFVYDDTFVDCRNDGSFVIDLNPIDAVDIFACVSGMKCGGDECSLPFLDFWIEADVPKFYETCVEALVDKTPFPTKAPAMSSKVEYTAQFEASWATVYDPLNASSYCASSQGDVGVTISCGIGANISFATSPGFDSSSCQKIRDNELQCSMNDNTAKNTLVSVFYVSVAVNLSLLSLSLTQ